MQLDKKYDSCIKSVIAGEKVTIKEEKTKISLKALCDFDCIQIDDCVLMSKQKGEKNVII